MRAELKLLKSQIKQISNNQNEIVNILAIGQKSAWELKSIVESMQKKIDWIKSFKMPNLPQMPKIEIPDMFIP